MGRIWKRTILNSMTEEILEKIKYEENKLRKMLLFMAWLNRKLKIES